MKYGILFLPTKEFVAFSDKQNKNVLFTEDLDSLKDILNDLLLSDGGYDGSYSDWSIQPIDTETDGSEYLEDDTFKFVSKDLIK